MYSASLQGRGYKEIVGDALIIIHMQRKWKVWTIKKRGYLMVLQRKGGKDYEAYRSY